MDPTILPFNMWKIPKNVIFVYFACRIFYGRRIFWWVRNFYHQKVWNLKIILNFYVLIYHISRRSKVIDCQSSKTPPFVGFLSIHHIYMLYIISVLLFPSNSSLFLFWLFNFLNYSEKMIFVLKRAKSMNIQSQFCNFKLHDIWIVLNSLFIFKCFFFIL